MLDPGGAPVAGARVVALPEPQGPGPSTQTGADGEFALALAPGRYALKVVAPGFGEAWQSVIATPAASESREFVLEVPSFRETVTVNAPSGYQVATISSATRTLTPLRDVPTASAARSAWSGSRSTRR